MGRLEVGRGPRGEGGGLGGAVLQKGPRPPAGRRKVPGFPSASLGPDRPGARQTRLTGLGLKRRQQPRRPKLPPPAESGKGRGAIGRGQGWRIGAAVSTGAEELPGLLGTAAWAMFPREKLGSSWEKRLRGLFRFLPWKRMQCPSFVVQNPYAVPASFSWSNSPSRQLESRQFSGLRNHQNDGEQRMNHREVAAHREWTGVRITAPEREGAPPKGFPEIKKEILTEKHQAANAFIHL